MLARLATFLHAHRRRVLAVAIVGAVIAGVFGSSVAKHLSPYGADDPATQSVQATNRFQHVAGRQIDAGVVRWCAPGMCEAPPPRLEWSKSRRSCVRACRTARRFLGWLEGDDLARAYASADLFVFASRTDTFGQVILEAQASGLACVAVDEVRGRSWEASLDRLAAGYRLTLDRRTAGRARSIA